jgi:hypothetical protein
MLGKNCLAIAAVACTVGIAIGWAASLAFREPPERIQLIPLPNGTPEAGSIIIPGVFHREPAFDAEQTEAAKKVIDALWGVDEGKRFVGHTIFELKSYTRYVVAIHRFNTDSMIIQWLVLTEHYGKAIDMTVSTKTWRIEDVQAFHPD